MGAANIAMVTKSPWQVERWFYLVMGLLMILLSVAGFAPSIIDESRRNAPATPLLVAHGIVTGAWLLFFVTQASLVATRRTAVHRRLGVAGLVLAAGLIFLGYASIIASGRRGYDLSGDLTRAISRSVSPRINSAALLFPMVELLYFGVLVAVGLAYRRCPEIHKRLMLLATVGLATEPILHLVGHLTGYWPALRGAGTKISVPITFLLLFARAIYDRLSKGRVHPVSLWVPLGLFASQNVLAFVVLPSAAWLEFAAWLIR